MVRIKERYLLVNILYPDALEDAKPGEPDLAVLHRPTTNDLTPQTILRAVRNHINDLFGGYGSGLVERGLQLKYLSNATSTFILRVHREHYRLVWAALTFMDRLPVKGGPPCTFRVAHVGGTMRKVEIAAIRRHKALVLAVEQQMGGSGGDVLDILFGGGSTEEQMRGAALTAQEDEEPGFGFDDDD